MSRHTEIEEQAYKAYESRIYEHDQEFADGIKVGFKQGAEWADRTMLHKVFTWLECNAYEYIIDEEGEESTIDIEQLILDLKRRLKK